MTEVDQHDTGKPEGNCFIESRDSGDESDMEGVKSSFVVSKDSRDKQKKRSKKKKKKAAAASDPADVETASAIATASINTTSGGAKPVPCREEKVVPDLFCAMWESASHAYSVLNPVITQDAALLHYLYLDSDDVDFLGAADDCSGGGGGNKKENAMVTKMKPKHKKK